MENAAVRLEGRAEVGQQLGKRPGFPPAGETHIRLHVRIQQRRVELAIDDLAFADLLATEQAARCGVAAAGEQIGRASGPPAQVGGAQAAADRPVRDFEGAGELVVLA